METADIRIVSINILRDFMARKAVYGVSAQLSRDLVLDMLAKKVREKWAFNDTV